MCLSLNTTTPQSAFVFVRVYDTYVTKKNLILLNYSHIQSLAYTPWKTQFLSWSVYQIADIAMMPRYNYIFTNTFHTNQTSTVPKQSCMSVYLAAAPFCCPILLHTTCWKMRALATANANFTGSNRNSGVVWVLLIAFVLYPDRKNKECALCTLQRLWKQKICSCFPLPQKPSKLKRNEQTKTNRA